MSLKKFLARPIIVGALKLLFLGQKFDLLEYEDYGNMGESYVYKFEAFRLQIVNDRGDYYAQLTQSVPTDIWKLSLILEYLGVAKEGEEFERYGLFSLVKELWLLSRNMAAVRELFEGEHSAQALSKLDELEAKKWEQLVEGLQGTAGR